MSGRAPIEVNLTIGYSTSKIQFKVFNLILLPIVPARSKLQNSHKRLRSGIPQLDSYVGGSLR